MGNNFKFILEYNEYIRDIDKSDKDEYIYNEILKRTKFGNLVITEGLIHTHPMDKSVNILNKRFPELIIDIEEDGDVYIENRPPQKLSKYLPIITNLGYFISKITINGKDWIKKFDGEVSPIAFTIEAKYDYEVSIPDNLYHASPIKFKEKILKWGLSPKSGNKLSNHPERIYLTDDIKKAIRFGDYLRGDSDIDWYKNGYCIYSIKGVGINKLYSDVNFRDGGYYTTDNIKKVNINILKEYIFKGEDLVRIIEY